MIGIARLVRRGLRRRGVVRIGDATDAAERALVAGAEPDRKVAALVGQRLEHVVLEVVEPPVEGCLAAGPEVAADRDRLVEIGAALVEALCRPNVAELLRVPADAESRDEPAA